MAKVKNTRNKQASKSKVTDAQIDEIVSNLAKPWMTDQEMFRAEDIAQSFGVSRRIALASITRSGDQLGELSRQDGDAYNEMKRAIDEFQEHAEAVFRTAKAAALRIRVFDERASTITEQ
jgi:hypothetical protein